MAVPLVPLSSGGLNAFAYNSAGEGRMPGLLDVPTMLTIAILMSKGKVIRTKTNIKKYRKIILCIRRIPWFSYSDNGIKPPVWLNSQGCFENQMR